MKPSFFTPVKRLLIFGIFAMIVLVSSLLASAPDASPQSTPEPLDDTLIRTNDCTPGSGWMWTSGPVQSEIAAQVQEELARKGITALVEVKSFGETDSCGTFHLFAIDFKIAIQDTGQIDEANHQELADLIYPTLVEFGKPNLGNVSVLDSHGSVISPNE